jgi:MFS superfamily sulfate permease-like transporter
MAIMVHHHRIMPTIIIMAHRLERSTRDNLLQVELKVLMMVVENHPNRIVPAKPLVVIVVTTPMVWGPEWEVRPKKTKIMNTKKSNTQLPYG